MDIHKKQMICFYTALLCKPAKQLKFFKKTLVISSSALIMLNIGISHAAEEVKRETVQTGYMVKMDCSHPKVSGENTKGQILVSFKTLDGKTKTSNKSISSAESFWSRATGNLLSDISGMSFDEAKKTAPPSAFSNGKSSPACSGGTKALYGVITPSQIKEITVETNSDDAFFMDQMELFKLKVDLVEEQWMDEVCKDNGGSNARCLQKDIKWDFKETRLNQWGRDKGKGYCMSTKANADFPGRYIDINGCNKIAKFSLNNKVTAVKRGDGEYQPSGYISIFNQAGYVSEHIITWIAPKDVGNGVIIPMPFAKSGKLSAGRTAEYTIPGNATNVTFAANGIGVIDPLDLKKTYKTGSTANGCFKVWGTIFGTEYGSVSCD